MFTKSKRLFLSATLALLTLLPTLSDVVSAAPIHEDTITAAVLSNGQFVYGPNIGDFKVDVYLQANAPHLLVHANDLYGRSEYFSINPKIYLTLLEVHSQLVSSPNEILIEDPFGLNGEGFNSQIDILSNAMSEAYYLNIYKYSAMPVAERQLEAFITPGGITLQATPETNAGTYAIMAGLAAMNQQNIPAVLDNNNVNGFYQTYLRLFGDDPLDESNQIKIPGELNSLAAQDNFLQLPYLQGFSWKFGGVHDTSSGGGDKSSIDFYPSGSTWGIDTSNMWIVAAAAGIPTRYSDCGFKVSHSGGLNVGWETVYYHLEGAQYLTGSIAQNQKIGVIANTLAEATCTGGAASGPHVHFSLKYNGAYTAINGTSLSGWFVHCDPSVCINNYDTDPTHMWLERDGEKKYPFNSSVLSEPPPHLVPPSVVSSAPDLAASNPTTVGFIVTFSKSVTGVDLSDFTLTSTGFPTPTIQTLSGSGSTYTVTVSTGGGNGTVRLNVLDDNTIIDASGNSLPSGFTTGKDYSTYITSTLRSIGTNDGWVLESSETSAIGGILNSSETTFHLGDDSSNKQYRGILHFSTASLPDNAVLVSAILKIKKIALVGTNPFTTHGALQLDIRKSKFGTLATLEAGDFQASATKLIGASFSAAAASNWYSAVIPNTSYTYINKAGNTQFRLRFNTNNNNDLGSDYLSFYSGDYATVSLRPQLIIKYYLP